jgi:hypothetical protein
VLASSTFFVPELTGDHPSFLRVVPARDREREYRQGAGKNRSEEIMAKYTAINESIEYRLAGGYLYVRLTGIHNGMLVQGERIGRVYRMPYESTLYDMLEQYETAIYRAMDPNHGEVVQQGRLIR